MQRKYYQYLSLLLFATLFMVSCKESEYAVPAGIDNLQNDCIKRTLGPNLVGLNIEFAYAMAIPPHKGKLVSAQVEASIEGASGTYLENKSYYTNGSGDDVGVVVGDPSVNKGAITEVTFTTDTAAATLRYYYVVPAEARGKSVKFTFSVKSSNGETVSYDMGPYTIAKMDMALDLEVQDDDACYISIANLAVYNAVDAAANADKVDLVYLYRSIPTINFGHALVSPAADPAYLSGAMLPVGVNNSIKISKAWGLRDYHLARDKYGIYIDDVDFQNLQIADAPNYAINLKEEAGAWVETADGKYRAYIYINSVNNSDKSAVISIKRYTLE